MTIIPAIDIINGKCVRLTQGKFESTIVYNEDPLEMAKQFEGAGLQRLHLVDLDGAKSGAVANWSVLESICSKTSLSVDFSGGISSAEILEKVFDSGVSFATIGSMAVKNENQCLDWIRKYGNGRFIISVDVKNGAVVINGWVEKTNLTVFEIIKKYTGFGVTHFMCTDVGRDGTLRGPSIDLYKSILANYPWLVLIASGGVSNIQDLRELRNTGVYGTIVGKAIYEKRVPLNELKEFS